MLLAITLTYWDLLATALGVLVAFVGSVGSIIFFGIRRTDFVTKHLNQRITALEVSDKLNTQRIAQLKAQKRKYTDDFIRMETKLDLLLSFYTTGKIVVPTDKQENVYES